MCQPFLCQKVVLAFYPHRHVVGCFPRGASPCIHLRGSSPAVSCLLCLESSAVKEVECQIVQGFAVGRQVVLSQKGQAGTKPRVTAVTRGFSVLTKWGGCKKEAQQMVVHVPCLRGVCTRERLLEGVHTSRVTLCQLQRRAAEITIQKTARSWLCMAG